MIEYPEAVTISGQMNDLLKGRRICSAVANASPHSFAWYCGDPAEYPALLGGRTFLSATSHGGHVEVLLDGVCLLFNDGASPRYLEARAKRPAKHQLLLELDDGAALSCSVQMYGGMMAFREGNYENGYYRIACEKPDPLSDAFDTAYFEDMRRDVPEKLSAKAYLATEQRIPGVGNGVLQDILYHARIHPKKAVARLTDAEYAGLYQSLKGVLSEMTRQGGRDVERDFLGAPGGYRTRCSKLTLDLPCPRCGTPIKKEAYLGGAVYYCPGCQTL